MYKKFVTIFDRSENVHLIKDVGQIPFHMHKNYNYNSVLVTCKNDEKYSYLENEVKGLKIKFIPKVKLFKINFGVILFLIKNAKKIDVLHQFHIRNYTLIYSFIYKTFNKDGISYIKADTDEKYLFRKQKVIKDKHLKYIKKYIDILSFETEDIVDLFKKQNPTLDKKVIKISNGVDEKYIFDELKIDNKINNKENSIVYVARVGSYQKNTELFLDALERIDLKDWKVNIIGEIATEFKPFIKSFFKRNNNLKDKIIFHGNISSRKEILNFYRRSKIVCLSSRYEGFPLIFPEALYFGNYIFTTDVSGANDITKNSQYGTIVKQNDVNEYSSKLEELISSEKLTNSLVNEIKEYSLKNFTWSSILQKLHRRIQEIK